MKQNEDTTMLAAVKKDGKWGFIDVKGNLAIDCTLYDVEKFERGLAVVRQEEKDSWQCLDRYGQIHRRNQYGVPDGRIRGPFNEGIAKVGYYETKEYTEKETVYDNVADFEGHTKYTTEYITRFVHGYMDENGKMLTGYVYASGSPEWHQDEISEGLIRVTEYGYRGYGYMDKTGKLQIPCQCGPYGSFHEGMAQTYKMVLGMFSKEGFINTKGEMVIKKRLYRAGDFHEGLAWVREKGKYSRYSYMNKQGITVIPAHFWQSCGDFHQGLACVRQEGEHGLWGYIDKEGKYAIPCQWDDCRDFHEGVAPVKKDGLWGYIDRTGKLVISCQWDDCRAFHEGVAWVKKEGLWGCIDGTGKWVIPCQWDWRGNFCDGVAKVEKNGLFGCVDIHGETITPCVWERLVLWDESV